MSKVHVKTGDKVVVINGKDRGKQGKVLQVSPSEGKVIVEGVNIVKKHVRPRSAQQQGGIIDQEAAIYASKVMLYCEKCKSGVRVGHKINEDGTKVRVCKKCGEVIE